MALQQRYYEDTAGDYHRLHEAEQTGHDRALELMTGLLPALGIRSLLDVGAGTGRALRLLRNRLPGLELHGIEPVEALAREGEKMGLPPGMIRTGDGAALPFESGSIDAVASFAVLHHVPEPSRVIREMTRVARKAVFISDSNRFAQGRPLARYTKLALHAVGLWPAFDWVRTRGKRYMVSEGDGVFFSYSVFDSVPQLRDWAPRLMMVELEHATARAGLWQSPLSNAPEILLVAVRPE